MFSKVLESPSDAQQFSELQYVRATEPTEDGVIDIGSGNVFAAFKIIPFAVGSAGNQFWMSITGWSPIGTQPNSMVWLGMSLGMFWCGVGDIPGPPNRPGLEPDRIVSSQENFCSRVFQYGGVPMVGMSADAWGITPVVLMLPTMGCQKIKFDFALGECEVGLGMNALWARA